MNALLIGLKEQENEEIARWQEASGGRCWVASVGLAGLRVFEEFEPDVVVVATILSDIDAVRLARTLSAARPSLRVVFVGAHHFEGLYYGNIEGLPNAHFAHRPLDPAHDIGIGTRSAGSPAAAPHGTVSYAAMAGLLGEFLRTGATGAIYAGSGAERRVVYLAEGRPMYAASMIASETLGQVLLASGRIGRVEFDWARNLQATQGVLQGEALTKIGVISQDDLDVALREHQFRKVVGLFGMTGAPWHAVRWDRPLRTVPDYGFRAVDVMTAGFAEFAPQPHAPEDSAVRLVEGLSSQVLDDARAALGAPVLAALAAGCTIEHLATLLGGSARAVACAEALTMAGICA